MPRGEIFLQMSVNYSADDKVRALVRFGRDARSARDLYVQMLCYCKENLTDGKVTRDEIGVLAFPDSVKIAEKHAGMLVSVGLAEATEYGWYVPGYLKRNKSKAQVEADAAEKARKGRESNHKRWHVDKTDPSCEFCPKDTPSGDRSGDRSGAGNGPYPHRSEVIGHRSEDRGQAPTPVASVARLAVASTARGNDLLDEHLDALDRRPSKDTIGDLGRKIDEAVEHGFADADIREGLGLLRRNPRLGPAMLSRLIDQAVDSRPRRRTESERMFG